MSNIDFHVHITPSEISANWKKYAEKEPYFSLLFNNNRALKKGKMFASAEDIVNVLGSQEPAGSHSLFDKAVVFGFAFCDLGLCSLVNDYVIQKVKEYPDKLIGFCVVPCCGKKTEKEIERCINSGLKGVGELFPAGQGIDLENKNQTKSITEICRSLGVPLLLHVNEQVGHDYKGKTQVPLKSIETFATKNPGLKIVLAHFGGGLLFYETMPEIKRSFADVYYDTAAAPFLYDARIYNIIKDMGISNKILFGSDYPLLHQSKYINAINESSLSQKEKSMIFGGNAHALLA